MNAKIIAVATLGLTLTFLVPADARSEGQKTYKVKITNLTAGQPLTPPILATHTSRAGFFKIGEAASEGIRQIAENGNGAVLLQALGEDSQINEVVTGTAPIVPANNPGGTGFESSATFTISTHGRARYLSYASMLICTNDGFTGLDSVRLPKHKKTVYTAACDARTETNTEDGVVIPHVGIHGGVDLFPEVHGWSDPVTKIEIELVRKHDGD